mgnify:CR=1 FL=1
MHRVLAPFVGAAVLAACGGPSPTSAPPLIVAAPTPPPTTTTASSPSAPSSTAMPETPTPTIATSTAAASVRLDFPRVSAAPSLVTHGLTMSLGGFDPLGDEFMRALRDFIREVKSPWHSDHLCFGSVDGRILHDLLPLAFTPATVERVADRVKEAQDRLGVPMAVENISFYMHPGKAEMPEAEFVARVCDRADCKLMLDVNNAYVNATNFGFDVDEWMRAVPLDRVVQMHVAGHEWFDDPAQSAAGAEPGGKVIIDTHGADVCDPVLALLERVLRKTGPVPVLLERDQNIPSLDTLLAELAVLRRIWDRATARPGAEQTVGA